MVENELSFISWQAFRRMAPSVLQLEISRLEALLHQPSLNVDFYNALVRARFALNRFVACLDRADQASLDACCAPHLRAAMLNLSVAQASLEEGAAPETPETLRYILNRLNDLYHRMALVY